MPQFPVQLGTHLLPGELPVTSAADVLEVLPVEYREAEVAPVRDAIIDGLVALSTATQNEDDYACLQSSMLTATDHYLDGFGDDRKQPRTDGELDLGYRARMCAIPRIGPRSLIEQAVNALVLQFSGVAAQVFEPALDRWFVGQEGVSTDVGFVAAAGVEGSPHYVNRFYPDDSVENGGLVRANSSPGGAICCADNGAREIAIRCPDLSNIDTALAMPGAGADPTEDAWFVASTSLTVFDRTNNFVGASIPSAMDIYDSILNIADTLRGAGIRVYFYVDPKLGA